MSNLFIRHTKLVRDNIPDIIAADGNIPHTHILSDESFRHELKNKLVEEVNEVLTATSYTDLVEELADVCTVIETIMKTYDIGLSTVMAQKKSKDELYGKFDKNIFLETVEYKKEK